MTSPQSRRVSVKSMKAASVTAYIAVIALVAGALIGFGGLTYASEEIRRTVFHPRTARLPAGVVGARSLATDDLVVRGPAHRQLKLTVCHRTSGGDRPYVWLSVDDLAVIPHLRHGDAILGCPGP